MVHPEAVVRRAVRIALELGKQAQQVGWTADRARPRLESGAHVHLVGLRVGPALAAVPAKQVTVEPALPLQPDTGENGPVERLFHHIGIDRVGLSRQHARGPHEHADLRTGFVVGQRVGQEILRPGGLVHAIVADRQPTGDSADAAVDEHLSFDVVAPDTSKGNAQCLLTGLQVDVHRACIEIRGQDRVPDHLGLLTKRNAVLAVVAAHPVVKLVLAPLPRCGSTPVHKPLCGIQVLPLLRFPVQLDQRHNDRWIERETYHLARHVT